jgi:hypothetical protein
MLALVGCQAAKKRRLPKSAGCQKAQAAKKRRLPKSAGCRKAQAAEKRKVNYMRAAIL